MRLTAIDIGTNTILMLVADLGKDGALTTVRDEHRIARLGKGVDLNRAITPETVERTLGILRKFKHISDECHSERIIACGTSALRDASNREEFHRTIVERLGFELQILAGDEEAELTYWGAVSEFLHPERPQEFAVLDVGGGSTELTAGVGKTIQQKQSLDIGCVRLTERVLKTCPPPAAAVSQAIEEIGDQVLRFSPIPSAARLIGVAGTLTTLAALDLELPSYDPRRVSGHLLEYGRIQKTFDVLRQMTAEEMLASPQILPGRADVLLAGILILLGVMRRLNVNQITVSDRGLRYGIVMREFLRMTAA